VARSTFDDGGVVRARAPSDRLVSGHPRYILYDSRSRFRITVAKFCEPPEDWDGSAPVP